MTERKLTPVVREGIPSRNHPHLLFLTYHARRWAPKGAEYNGEPGSTLDQDGRERIRVREDGDLPRDTRLAGSFEAQA